MPSCCWLLLSSTFLILHGIPMLASGQNGVCLLQQIQAKSSFNVNRYLGVWYEMNWLPPTPEPLEDQWTDVTQTYRLGSKEVVYGTLLYRSPQNPDRCHSGNFTLETTAQSGKLNKVAPSGNSPYWVMDTDYTSYALVYECFSVKENDTCDAPFLSIWSRTTSLDSARLASFKTTTETQLCLNWTLLLTARQDNPCSRTGSAPVLEANLFVVALMSVVIKVLSP